jgi:hypothetical protein
MFGMGKRQTKLSQQLLEQMRQAIDESGLTFYRIAKETGMDKSALGKMYSGQRAFSPGSLDTLGEFFGLRLTIESDIKRKGK